VPGSRLVNLISYLIAQRPALLQAAGSKIQRVKNLNALTSIKPMTPQKSSFKMRPLPAGSALGAGSLMESSREGIVV
jgi:hypothetical protein